MTKQTKGPEAQQSEIEKFYQDTLTLSGEISARLKSGMLTSHDQARATEIIQETSKIMSAVTDIINAGKEKMSASDTFNAVQLKEAMHPLDYYCLANAGNQLIEAKKTVQAYSEAWQEMLKGSDQEVAQTLTAFKNITFAPK